MKPTVTIILTTYNRAALLKEALNSILGQDYPDFEAVVLDDASNDSTQAFMEAQTAPRIVYVRSPENIGQRFGDTPIVGKGLREHTRGRYWCHINDDDAWLSPDLLSRQIAAFEQSPSLAVVIGGVAQQYPHPIEPFLANAPYLENQFIAEDLVFVKGVFPTHLMTGREFAGLFADDPANRNIVCGAMMFDLDKVPLADYFGEGYAGQAGPAMICGAAMHGDVLYLDSPELLNRVERNCLSFKGTQHSALRECLASADAAFIHADMDDELKSIRERLMKSYFAAYLGNKIAFRLGWFKSNPLGDLDSIFDPPISADEFVSVLTDKGIALTQDNQAAIALADGPLEEITKIGVAGIRRMCA